MISVPNRQQQLSGNNFKIKQIKRLILPLNELE